MYQSPSIAVKYHRLTSSFVLDFYGMAPKRRKEMEETAALNLRGIPLETFYRLKMAAAAEHKSVRDLLMDLIEGKILELEKKGLLPKGKH